MKRCWQSPEEKKRGGGTGGVGGQRVRVYVQDSHEIRVEISMLVSCLPLASIPFGLVGLVGGLVPPCLPTD